MRELIAVLLVMGLVGCPAPDDGGAGEGGYVYPIIDAGTPPPMPAAGDPGVDYYCAHSVACMDIGAFGSDIAELYRMDCLARVEWSWDSARSAACKATYPEPCRYADCLSL